MRISRFKLLLSITGLGILLVTGCSKENDEIHNNSVEEEEVMSSEINDISSVAAIGHKDNDEKTSELLFENEIDQLEIEYVNQELEKISEAEVGDIVIFGKYEQDGYDSNGPEPIEWEVLSKEGNRVLLVSRYVLDSIPYEDSDESYTTWENCSLREWLNNDFQYMAFSVYECSKIPTSTIFTNTYDGSVVETQDCVFILGLEDLKKYYNLNSEENSSIPDNYFSEELMTETTTFAINNGVKYSVLDEYTNWMGKVGYSHDLMGINEAPWRLREQTGARVTRAVLYYGSVSSNEGVRTNTGIRPAIYIEL